jgi:hypothetical protein
MTTSLTEATREMLCNRPRELTYEQLSAELGISIDWLTKFACKHIKKGSADRVQVLYERLSGRKLLGA